VVIETELQWYLAPCVTQYFSLRLREN
jgi:hypothetical protein